jgi:hypothetical protein
MDQHNLRPLLLDEWIPKADGAHFPFFIDNPEFCKSIQQVLRALGVEKKP